MNPIHLHHNLPPAINPIHNFSESLIKMLQRIETFSIFGKSYHHSRNTEKNWSMSGKHLKPVIQLNPVTAPSAQNDLSVHGNP